MLLSFHLFLFIGRDYQFAGAERPGVKRTDFSTPWNNVNTDLGKIKSLFVLPMSDVLHGENFENNSETV
jgi:hypothetical protein